jgi:ribosome-associated heat shock protein Hsp15
MADLSSRGLRRFVSIAQGLCYGKSVMAAVRIDKWLWAARFFKSRTLAAAACDGGKVDINEQAAKPSRPVRPGDRLHITLPRGKKIIRVRSLAERRGSAAQAQLLYDDFTPPPPPKEARIPPVYRARGLGRPTKRQRRLIDRLSRW